MNAPATPAQQARGIARACRTATLATSLAGAPYASLVLVAFDLDGSPLLLISRLADHTKNILADARVSLLCDGTTGFKEPLTGPRASLQGRAEKTEDARLQARYVARHPAAAMYAGFGDFGFYRIGVERTHLVAGFGRIHWFDDYTLDGDWSALAEAEAAIIQHMNADHADAVQLYAERLLGRTGGGWQLCGIDPEGCDLIRGDEDAGRELARLPFAQPISDAATARAELVRLVQQAKAA